MEKVSVSLKREIDESYGILIEPGLLSKVPFILKEKNLARNYAIICDSKTLAIFGKRFFDGMKKAGLNAFLLSFPAGEKSKSLKALELLQEKMLALGLGRDSAVIALGGGVTGDLAGFVAATYMRGISVLQVPTTLLAMVDSSIGGKVGVDLRNGKNSCGAFCQPKAVFVDLDCLKSLPEKEFRNGLAEIVKHAVIADAELFSFLEQNCTKIIERNPDVISRLVKWNCEIKARIVEKDFFEGDLRKIVNYGHSVGHALEVLGNFKELTHGEAISIGLAAAGAIAVKLGFISKESIDRQNLLLEKFGLPVKLPNYPVSKIVSLLKHDKKNLGGKTLFVFPESIGKMKTVDGKYGIAVEQKIVEKVLAGLK